MTPLRKTSKPGHNWRESAVIAAEDSGDGQIVQLYRQRADAENVFDELKNQ